MTHRLLFTLLLGIGIAAGPASASTVSYAISVDTPYFGAPGWIDFTFDQGNAATSLSATAAISDFQQTAYTLDSLTQSTPSVSGDLTALPVVIPNDTQTQNNFTQHVLIWGSSFSFVLTLSGDAIGGSAADGSAFLLTLFDESFNPFVGPLDFGSIANVVINPDGSLTANDGAFSGGSASVVPLIGSAVPEPATGLLSIAALAGLYCRRKK